MIIIGITGTLGAGKGTIVDYLVSRRGFLHFSVRDFIKDEIILRGMPVDRDSMVVVANSLRAANSPSFIVDQLYEQAAKTGQNCVIESIRTLGEVVSLRAKGNFVLLAVDADPDLRYGRIKTRNSETDHVTFSTFLENERREMDSDDPNKQNLRQVIRQADITLSNNGSMEELISQVENALSGILKKG